MSLQRQLSAGLPGTQNENSYIELLTGLRGLAALIVFVSHASNTGVLPRILGHGFGQVGVQIFFALSGFLMAHMYIDRPSTFETVQAYALSRVARIFPLYFAIIIFSVIVSPYLQTDSWYPFDFSDPDLIATSLLMLKSKYVFWSIPVEVQFYVVFIGLWILVARSSSVYRVLFYLILISTPSIIIFFLFDSLPNVLSKFTHVFFMGILIASIHKKLRGHTKAIRISNFIGLPATVLLLVNLPELRLLAGLSVGDSTYFRVWLDPATLFIVGSVVLLAAMESSSMALLRSRLCLYFGKISYGFYLFHLPILMFHSKYPKFGSAGVVIFSLLCTMAVSHISLVYFEQPIGKRIRKWRHHKK